MSTEPKQTTVASRQHLLKTWPIYFREVKSRRKKFELRRNDRDFQEGDVLALVEFDPKTENESGDVEMRRAGYILRGPEFGLEPGFCIISLEDME